jgi:N-acetylglucosamine PTS system EIICBA or EIICB component
LGARGVVRPSATTMQVVLGPIADQVASEIQRALRSAPRSASDVIDPQALLKVLGGRTNVLDLAAVPGRLLLKLAKPDTVEDHALTALSGVRAVGRPQAGSLHLLVAGPVESAAAPLRTLLQ